MQAATAFVPIAIFNNLTGKDAEVLRQFKEPAWNNPVVRFVDADGKDLIPRKDGVYSKDGLLNRMTRALSAAGQPIPTGIEQAEPERVKEKTE